MLLAMQMLPVQCIGKMLCSNQWTEEIPHNTSDDEGKADASAPLIKDFLPADNFIGLSCIEETMALIYIHSTDQVPPNHSADVVSPPPDVLA